jgi:hypothetical protein
MASEHYHELVWDYLYGLLDPAEAQAVRGHIEICPECRAALVEAEGQQQVLARAARVIIEVPAFHIPGQSHGPPDLGTVHEPPVLPEGSSATSTLPMLASKPPRSALRRFWPSWAAAAAVLATALGLNHAYQDGFSRRQTQVAAARRKVEAANGVFATFQADVAKRQENEARRLREQLPPQLNVLVPAQVLSEGPAVIRVATRDIDGKPRAADITTSILEPSGGKVLEKKVERIQGDGTIQLPAPKANASVLLRVEAKTEKGDAKIEETLQVVEPTLASHLALNKSVYSTGDVLFFRALTLDRYSLKPPVEPVPLRFALTDISGRSVREVETQTLAGGVSAGEMQIKSDLPAGNYALNVSTANAKSAMVVPQSRGLVIVRDNNAQIARNNDNRNSDKKNSAVTQSSPVASAERIIEFFPEGGDLVAGVAQRVYYRVRSPQGELAEPEGKVTILAGGKVLYQSEPRQGLGAFTFTPDAKESYAVRITGAPDTTIANPFQKLGIKPEGVVLHAAQSVSPAGTPLTLMLSNRGTPRQLLLQATCRGQIVEQQYVDLQTGTHEVKLAPAAGTAGVVRVTVWEAAADKLVPLAERLLYLVPEKRLDVSVQLSGGPGPHPPGAKMAMELKATDEQHQASRTWMLAAVVDEKYQRQKSERSLAAHFYLAGDVSGDELDNAALALNDLPEAWQALDLFLGTQGWRRFVSREPSALLALREPAPAKEAKAAASSNTAFFSLQNTTPQDLQDTYQKTWQREVNKLVVSANQERANLIDAREASLQALDQAVRELAEFEELPGEYFRLTLGVLTLTLLVMGAGFLAIGLARLIRKKEKRPTAYVAAAFSCMFACMVLYFVAGRMPAASVVDTKTEAVAAAPAWPEFHVDDVVAATANASHARRATIAPAPAVGYFVTQAPVSGPGRDGMPLSLLRSDGNVTDNLAKRSEGTLDRAQNFNRNQAQNNQAQDTRGVNNSEVRQSAQANVETQRRFVQLAKAKDQIPPPAPSASFAKPAAQAAGAAAPGAAGGFGAASKVGDERGKGGTAYFREYAYHAQQGGRTDAQGTLLWLPFLDCPDGRAQTSFDLPQTPSTYRVLVYANSPSGRLGFYEGKLEVGPQTRK